MSNSYFSSSNYTTYDALPTEVKYSFVTLSCQCQLRGEGEDCCLASNAVLDSTGSDPDGPPPSEEQEAYLNDVCITTAGAIGDNVAPGTGELPVTAAPDGNGGDGTDGTDSTPAPTVPTPQVVGPDGSGETDNNREITDEGMSGGAWAGIAIAGAAGLTMILYLIMRKEGEEDEVELDENADVTDVRKERNASGLMVKTGDDGNDNGPISPSSTMDATQSITEAHSDVSSLPSSIGMSKSTESGEVGEGYNDLNLLPRPEDESVLSGDEDSYFYNNNGTSSLAAMGVASGAIVGMG